MTIERFLGCAESAVLILNNPMKWHYVMQPCARPTDLFVVSCPDPTLTYSSHMTNGILLTRHNREIAQWSPDPFPCERVGSWHKTTHVQVCQQSLKQKKNKEKSRGDQRHYEAFDGNSGQHSPFHFTVQRSTLVAAYKTAELYITFIICLTASQ